MSWLSEVVSYLPSSTSTIHALVFAECTLPPLQPYPHINIVAVIDLQVNGPLSLKCCIQAMETCYIRLCHKAELRIALSETSPRHPHSPSFQPGVEHDIPSQLLPRSASSCSASARHAAQFGQGQASNPDLICLSAPDASVVGSQADSSPHAEAAAAPLPASEPTSEEGAAQHGPRSCAAKFGLNQIDYCCMHSPFHKLVRKAFARLTHIDHLRQQTPSYQAAMGHKQVRMCSVRQTQHSTLYAV